MTATHCREDTTCCNHLRDITVVHHQCATERSLSNRSTCPDVVSKEPPGTFSRDGTGVKLAVVPPAGPHRAAALFLGRVPRQDVVAGAGVVQVVVALSPLLVHRAGSRGVSRQCQAHVICQRRTRRAA